MKILLIKPCWPFPYSKGDHTYNRIWPPLSLANCAAILEREGHQVKILDAHALRISPLKIKSYAKGYDKIFVTSSTLDRWQCPNIDIQPFLETVQHIKEETDEVYVMGYHGTVHPEGVLNQTGAKAVIRDEPEFTVSTICKNRDLKEIPGISFRRDGSVIYNAQASNFDLKLLPTPAFHLLDMKKYSYEILGKDFALLEINRGCVFSCKFCNLLMYGPKLRSKSKEQVFEEIRVAVEDNDVRSAYFMDLEFLANKKLAGEMCDFLMSKNYDFSWCCQTRADSLNMDILIKMKNAGCELVHLGIESGVQKFLDLSQKHLTPVKVSEAVQMCKKVGIKTLGFYLFGFQGETEQDREQTFDFAKNLDTDFVSFHKVYPYKEENIYSMDIQLSKKIDGFIRNKYWKYYFRLSIFRKLNIATLLRGLNLFIGRLKTLH